MGFASRGSGEYNINLVIGQFSYGAVSSVWQSSGLLIRVSRVRIPDGPPKNPYTDSLVMGAWRNRVGYSTNFGSMVEMEGLEPSTSTMPLRRSPNWATSPYWQTIANDPLSRKEGYLWFLCLMVWWLTQHYPLASMWSGSYRYFAYFRTKVWSTRNR